MPQAHWMLGLPAFGGAYEFGQVGTGLPRFRFHRRMSSFFLKRTNGIPERGSWIAVIVVRPIFQYLSLSLPVRCLTYSSLFSLLFLYFFFYSAAMCGVCPGTLVTWPWLRLSTIVLWDLGLRFASHVIVAGSWVRSPCPVVTGQAASCPWDGSICTRWIWSISSSKIWVLLLWNAGC